MTFFDSCDLEHSVSQSTHLHSHILDLMHPIPIDQDTVVDVEMCNFISDKVLVKCSIAFPRQVVHIPNKV